MSKGFITFNRDFFEESEYSSLKKFDEWHAYIDLIQKAQYAEKTTPSFLEGYELHMGQVAMSQVTLADRWKWSSKTVRKFLIKLKRKRLIDYRPHPIKNPITTIITIKRYSEIIIFPNEIPTLNNPIKKEEYNINTTKDIKIESRNDMSLKGEIIEWILFHNKKDGIQIDEVDINDRLEDAISNLGFDRISAVFNSIKKMRYPFVTESFWSEVNKSLDNYQLSLLDHHSDKEN